MDKNNRTIKRVVQEDCIVYAGPDAKIGRPRGPTFIHFNGTLQWYAENEIHRIGHPAYINPIRMGWYNSGSFLTGR